METSASCEARSAPSPYPTACTTRACRRLEQQLAQQCPASAGCVARGLGGSARSGLVLLTTHPIRTLKRSRRGRVRVVLKLNRTGRALLARSTVLPLEVHVAVRERAGATLGALLNLLLRR